MTTEPVRRALISVYDKKGLIPFAQGLADIDVEILSTGGSARALQEAGIPVREVSDLTGFPEMMDGRVKTLHPKVHGGLLAIRDNPAHRKDMTDKGIQPIDLVAVNLYPFEETVAKGADFATCIENIDIGGPAMIRSAAKNHAFVTVLVDPEDYQSVLNELTSSEGMTSPETRRKLSAKAFRHTAAYDAAISNWFLGQTGEDPATAPETRVFGGRLRQTLRYGENPHQYAAFYTAGDGRPGVATAQQIQGKELSYINILDADAAFELVAEFDPAVSPAVAIIKHANPCGVATGPSLKEAYGRALLCDPVSRFGGIIAVNQTLDEETAEEISKLFTEVIIAPDADAGAKAVIEKKKNVRLLLAGGLPDASAPGWAIRSVAGGYLVQTRDNSNIDAINLEVVTKRSPTDQELADLKFAFRVCKHVKSNAIVYAKNGATVGIGAGQMSRLDSSRIAAQKSRDAAEEAGRTEPLTKDSVVASDAFFPFPDGLLAAAEAGATAVIQPGGSMRDQDVIAAADEAGLAMVFSGCRQFRH